MMTNQLAAVDNPRATMTVPEAAERLGIGRNTAYQAAEHGELPTIRVGGRVLVLRSVLDDLLAGRTSPGP
jgi:excisionase family DNA binding protein